ncbi:S8 family serine peptidase [Salipiger mucosus]|uniref:Alkaline phosphatase n=1 Tax=Salipiger mucosus DSM 16094 TaxID=1123237 RepID=S9QG01_9RHOB|nr:S8 family serine peptidase [Salipiger mucosus]EPX78513.1 Alkaline phosphatase [Salipiger mucosus DSM 16094]
MPTTPTDPLYASQWHFPLLGDIETVWDEFTGAGVHVGVYDDGIEYTHPDLSANYDASRHVLDNTLTPVDPFPVLGSDAHGTSVAGLIAATAFNGEGGVGVSWGAMLTGVNIFNSGVYGYVNAGDTTPFMDVAGQAGGLFDISSNSWGSTPVYSQGFQNLNAPGTFAAELDAEYASVSANGRGGLGTVINQAAGNDTLEADGSGTNASRFTNTIGATDANGDLTYYSNFGSSILVVAPAGAVTTDRTGSNGYGGLPDPDYTNAFGGTSAATPITSGVTALMLEANPGLGWRDVQNILANSASHTGSAYGSGPAGYEIDTWGFNNAGNVNGGGQHVSGSYGNGMVDAFVSVRNAEVWDLFGEARTSANEQSVTSNFEDFGGGSVALPDGDPAGYTFTLDVTDDLEIEHVAFDLTFTTTYVGDIRITITSPDGTEIVAKHEGGVGTDVTAATWTFGIDQLRGESAQGTWTVTVADVYAADLASIQSAQLTAYGAPAGDDDVYHYNDEFLEMLAADAASRASLQDAAGTDWLNLAPVTGDVALDLANDGTGGATVDATSWFAIASGTIIENAVTGDGNDTLTGNGYANELLGMRGNDTLSGGYGEDVLDGGTGDDNLDGGSGMDTLIGGAGNDTMAGGSNYDTADFFGASAGVVVDLEAGTATGEGTDALSGIEHVLGSAFGDDISGTLIHGNLLEGFEGNDTLTGLDGNDTLLGGDDDDSLYGGDDRDRLEGEAGSDVLAGGSHSDTLHGGLGDDVMDGEGGYDTALFSGIYAPIYINLEAGSASGGAGTDVLSNLEHVFGGASHDTIYGTNAHGNRLEGSAGNDTIYGLDGRDTILGGNSDDRLYGGDDVDKLLGGAQDDFLDGGGGTDFLTGGTGADTFVLRSIDDTGVGRWKRDEVRDFDAAEGDVISVYLVDADATTAGNQAFTYAGTAFTGTAGEIILNDYVFSGVDVTIASMDVDGDAVIDGQLYIVGGAVIGDFVL